MADRETSEANDRMQLKGAIPRSTETWLILGITLSIVGLVTAFFIWPEFIAGRLSAYGKDSGLAAGIAVLLGASFAFLAKLTENIFSRSQYKKVLLREDELLQRQDEKAARKILDERRERLRRISTLTSMDIYQCYRYANDFESTQHDHLGYVRKNMQDVAVLGAHPVGVAAYAMVTFDKMKGQRMGNGFDRKRFRFYRTGQTADLSTEEMNTFLKVEYSRLILFCACEYFRLLEERLRDTPDLPLDDPQSYLRMSARQIVKRWGPNGLSPLQWGLNDLQSHIRQSFEWPDSMERSATSDYIEG